MGTNQWVLQVVGEGPDGLYLFLECLVTHELLYNRRQCHRWGGGVGDTGTDPIEPVAQEQVTVTDEATSVDPAASQPLPLNIQPIPEPGTLILLGLGVALTTYRRRRHGRRDPGP